MYFSDLKSKQPVKYHVIIWKCPIIRYVINNNHVISYIYYTTKQNAQYGWESKKQFINLTHLRRKKMHLNIVSTACMQSSNESPSYLLDWLLLLMQIFVNSKDSSSARPSFINWSPFQPRLPNIFYYITLSYFHHGTSRLWNDLIVYLSSQ